MGGEQGKRKRSRCFKFTYRLSLKMNVNVMDCKQVLINIFLKRSYVLTAHWVSSLVSNNLKTLISFFTILWLEDAKQKTKSNGTI